MNFPNDQTDWQVIYTYPKFEKKVNQKLEQLKIHSFLPMHEVIRQWSDRKKKLKVPLFPNYLFVKVSNVEKWKVSAIAGVVKFINDNGKSSFVSDRVISSIKKACSKSIEVVNQVYKTGDPVNVVSGPLMGVQGTLVEWKGKSKLVISIDMLKQSILVEVNPEDLEKKLELVY